MKKFILFALFAFMFVQCSQRKAIPITELSQKEIKNASLVDVRTPEEYNAGHLENAVNINWYDEDFEQQVKTLSMRKTIYVYCKKGVRSAMAAKVIDSLGYEVVDLLGGYDAHPGSE